MLAIGTRVMVIGNDDPVIVGKLIGYETYGKPNTNIPMVEDELYHKTWYCGGIVVEYDEALYQTLVAIASDEERYKFMCLRKRGG